MVDLKLSHKILIIIVVFIGLLKLSKFKLPKFNTFRTQPATRSAPMQTMSSPPPREVVITKYVTIPSTPSASQAPISQLPMMGYQQDVAPRGFVMAPREPVKSASVSFLDEMTKQSSPGSISIDSDAFNRFYGRY